MPSYGGAPGGQSSRPLSGGVPGRPVDDPRVVGIGVRMDPGATVKDMALGFGVGRPEVRLPPDASSTLYVEGLPNDCTRREVARILSLAIVCNPYNSCTSLLHPLLNMGSQIFFGLLLATKKLDL